MAEAAASGDWVIDSGFAAHHAADASPSFYALYNGADFAAPERGFAAVIAQAHMEAGLPGAGARDAAQLAVHGFAEGYFGAQRTLSTRRAAAISLTALNRWFAGQMHGSASARRLVPVSLSALLLHQRRIGIAQIGACQLYRLRAGVLTPLIRPHLRLGDAAWQPARALGLEDDLATGHEEDEAEQGDVYLLLAGAGAPDAVYTALASLAEENFPNSAALATAILAALPAPAPAVMALRILGLPPATESAVGSLAHLPIRPAPKEGDVWDDFLIGKTLFRGRYTILKVAYDRQARREVALKIPLKTMLQDEIFSAGFMREAWIGSAVRGSNVVHYIDIPATRRTSLYLVMPLYRGETLEARLNRAPLINLPEGMGVALKLCEAVQDLATIQVIHRDLKPDNVMLLHERGEVRLLDLGLAYLPGIDTADAVKPGGTIRYMAPELLHGAPASARTELYALAVTIYRMFSGGPFPFGQRESTPLARLRPDLPAWLGETLARALAARPEDRFADAGEFAAALQMGLATGVEAPSPPRHHRPSALHLWQAATLAFAITTLVLVAKLLK